MLGLQDSGIMDGECRVVLKIASLGKGRGVVCSDKKDKLTCGNAVRERESERM